MKKLFIIILIILHASNCLATKYYVRNGGSDSNSGLSDANAWATIAKVNSSSFSPGDSILFKRGSSWNETLIISNSGTSGARITYADYGTGEKPRISGLTTVTGWTVHSGSVYRASVLASAPNVLAIDGVNTPMGRYPNAALPYRWNATDLTIDNYSYNSITDAALPSSPDLDGAEIVIRTRQWVTETRQIVHSGTTLTLASGNFYYTPVSSGQGYFVRNHLALLDADNEWYYNDGTLYIYGNPSGETVRITTRSNLVEVSSKDYITLKNLILEGANDYAIYATNSDYLIIENCDILYGGNTAIYCESNCISPIIRYCNITDINNYAIVARNVNSITIEYNNISYIGYINGAGGSGDEDYTGIVATGYGGKIRHNRLTHVGYSGIRFGGQDTELSYNFLDSICLNKSDGGGFYTYRDFETGKSIHHNIIMNVLPQEYGWSYYDYTSATAIYLDGAHNTTITDNVLAHCANGMYINCAQDVSTERNLCYDNTYGLMLMTQYGELAEDQSHAYNIYFSRYGYNDQYCMYIVAKSLGESYLYNWGTSDYNYYICPINDDNYIATQYNAWGGTYAYLNLTEWQSASGKDAHSNSTPVTVSSDDQLHFVYNDTTDVRYYNITGTLRDHANNIYTGSMSLLPFTGIVLMGSGSVTEVDEEYDSPRGFLFYFGKRVKYSGKFVKW